MSQLDDIKLTDEFICNIFNINSSKNKNLNSINCDTSVGLIDCNNVQYSEPYIGRCEQCFNPSLQQFIRQEKKKCGCQIVPFKDSKDCKYSVGLQSCFRCFQCDRCERCTDCIQCFGICDQQYVYRNQQLSKEEYQLLEMLRQEQATTQQIRDEETFVRSVKLLVALEEQNLVKKQQRLQTIKELKQKITMLNNQKQFLQEETVNKVNKQSKVQ